MLTADEGRELAKMINSPHVQLHLDCKAMSSESKPIPEIVRANRDIMVHFHANDPNRQGPGFGELDFVPIFAADTPLPAFALPWVRYGDQTLAQAPEQALLPCLSFSNRYSVMP